MVTCGQIWSKHPEAQKAMGSEWCRLRDKRTWDESVVREWHEVASEARRLGKEIHLGRLFGIMVQKGAELPDSDKRKKYKYRVVF